MNINQFEGAARRASPILFITIIVAVLAASFFRVMIGGGPWVFADEFSYALHAKALWSNQADPGVGAATGNWIYLLINSTCFAFNEDYLSLSRIWNVLSTVLAGSVFFVMFRRFVGDAVAMLATTASIALFAAGYARLFMPEAMQFAVVMLAICSFQSYGQRPTVLRIALLGGLLGVGGLIKVHVFLLVPCFLVGIAMIGYVKRIFWRNVCVHLILCLFFVLLVAYTIRLVISGKTDFNLLGEFYSGVAKQVGSARVGIPRYGYVLVRHIETLLLAFSPVVAMVIFSLIGLRRNGENINIVRCTIAVLVMCMLGMMLVTTIFTVGIAGSGPYESFDRLHGRYYEHILIILAAVACVHAPALIQGAGKRLRFFVLLSVAVCLAVSFFATRTIGWQNPIDFVSVFGLYSVPHARSIALSLGLIALAICLIRPALAGLAGVLMFALVLSFSAYQLDKVWVNRELLGVERAAMLIVDADDTAPVVVASSSANADLYRAGFYLLRENASLVVAPELADSTQSCPQQSSSAAWLLIISPSASINCDNFDKFMEFDGAAVYKRRGWF